MRMLSVSLVAVAAAAAFGSALAQQPEAPPSDEGGLPQEEPVFADPYADPFADPLEAEPLAPGVSEAMSELDSLSRSADDPYSAFAEVAQRRPVSVTLRALDKITARYIDIEAAIGEPAAFASLEIVPRFCDKRPPEDFPETTAFLEIFDRDRSRARASASAASVIDEAIAEPAMEKPVSPTTDDLAETHYTADNALPPSEDRVFSGWMFASSPALNALEHPIYDVWVIDCKTVAIETP